MLRTEVELLEDPAPLVGPSKRAMALRLKAMADEVEQLQGDQVQATVGTMTPLQAASAMRHAKSKGFTHPFYALINKQGISIAEAAAKLGVMQAVARSWTRASQTRPIARSVAEKAQELWGLPATAKNWPNGIRSKD